MYREPLRGAQIVEEAAEAEAVVLTQQRTPFPADVISGLPKLRWLLNTGRNTSHLDADACDERGIQIIKGGGGNHSPPAELTWALILAAAKRLVENSGSLRAGQWQCAVGTGLAGKTLAVYGLGSIGSKVAQVGAAFGMHILCFGRRDHGRGCL